MSNWYIWALGIVGLMFLMSYAFLQYQASKLYKQPIPRCPPPLPVPSRERLEALVGDGIGYEKHCRSLLEAAGWKVLMTPTSGDRGVDLIALKEDLKVAIQCKSYHGTVGTAAVQQICAGARFERADFAIVVAPNGFTRQARDLAVSIGVYLIGTNELTELYDRLS